MKHNDDPFEKKIALYDRVSFRMKGLLEQNRMKISVFYFFLFPQLASEKWSYNLDTLVEFRYLLFSRTFGAEGEVS